MTPYSAAIFRALLGIAFLSGLDACIKFMAEKFPTAQNVAIRFGVGTVLIVLVMFILRAGVPTWETVKANATRSILAAVSTLAFFYAIGELPLAEVLVLTFLSPVFIALLSVPLLGERVDRRVLVALVIGLIGLSVVVFGQVEGGQRTRSLAGVAAALFSAVTYATSLILLRARAQKDPLIHIVFMMHLGPTVMVSPLAYGVWVAPNSIDMVGFFIMGVLGLAGHYLMASAYKQVQAARLAPLEYTAMIWAVLLGYAIFKEIPTVYTFLGGALIIIGAFISSRR